MKKIIFHSNYHKLFTGFGKNAKNIISYLYKTGKYEIIEVANGKGMNDPELSKFPWKCIGAFPDPSDQISPEEQKKPEFQRNLSYGHYKIDEIIAKEKPDVYIGAEDIWAFDGFTKRAWWNKINCMIWTTLDSLPIIDTAVNSAPKIENFYTWASFASKDMNRMGYSHVKALNGSVDTSKFYKLKNEDKIKLRRKFNINKDDFIIGFVFRNQLRKSVPNLLDGFKLFLEKNPKSKAKLLLHTHWSEGWDIPRLIKEKQIDPNLILTTYFCKACRQYEIKPFYGQNQDCGICGASKSQETTNIVNGVSESQLNEIYNIMNVYCHPFTSGGMEIPIFEAKLTGLITLVTNYSCGEDSCTKISGGLPLEWSEYREPGTQFIKATTSAKSISENLELVFNMSDQERIQTGDLARDFVLKNYSIDVIGKKLEEIIDNMPDKEYDFNIKPSLRDPNYNPPIIKDDVKWLIDIYKNILKVDVDISDKGLQDWVSKLKQGAKRSQVLDYFKSVAFKENQQIHKPDFEDFLDKDDQDKRIAIVISGEDEDVFLSNSLLNGIKKQYPNHNIYAILKPEFFPLISSNKNLHKCIPFSDQLQDPMILEGKGKHKGYFNIAFYPETTKNKKSFCRNNLK